MVNGGGSDSVMDRRPEDAANRGTVSRKAQPSAGRFASVLHHIFLDAKLPALGCALLLTTDSEWDQREPNFGGSGRPAGFAIGIAGFAFSTGMPCAESRATGTSTSSSASTAESITSTS
jgi:hypothetical protein